jgi:Flp pilus assembly protein TadG
MRAVAWLKSIFGSEDGSSLVETALAVPVILALMVGVVDLGRAYYLAMEVAGAAHAGAEYGVQSPSDATGIKAAAAADAPDVPNLTVATPVYGCECSDGTSYSVNCANKPTCAANVVYSVKVTVSASYRTLFPWPGLPTTMPITNSATMRSGGT